MERKLLAILLYLVMINAHALAVSIQLLTPSYCGRPSGRAYANVSGGLPPYTYLWSNGGTDVQLEAVVGGTYSVTVTDANSDQATADIEIPAATTYGVALAGYSTYSNPCPGELPYVLVYTGMESISTQPDPSSIYGPGPYQFSHPSITESTQVTKCTSNNSPVFSFLQFDQPEGAAFVVDFTDADGCPGQMDVYMRPAWDPPVFQIVGVGGSCANGYAGSVAVSVNDGVGKSYRFYVRRADETPACPADLAGSFASDGSFGDYIHTLDGLAPGDHYLVWTNDVLGVFENNPFVPVANCKDSVLFNVPELSTDCGSVSGRLFIDDDLDCALDFPENRVPNTILSVVPGPFYLFTNGQGEFASPLPYGDYTITEQHPLFDQSCTGALTISTPAQQTFNIGCAPGQPLDVQIMAASGPARPGFELEYGVSIDNLTSSATDVVTVTLEVDPQFTFLSCSTPPSSVAGNILTWTSPEFTMTQPFQHRLLNPHFQIPADVGLIGSTLSATATITTTNVDGDLSNNTYVTSIVVTGSFDPNDKVGVTSSRSSAAEFLIDEDEWIDYTIRFQNTGTDTAFSVLITDTLEAPLDPASVVVGAASHPYTWDMDIHGVLRVSFANIMLPDSNVDEAGSHGFVMLRSRPLLPLIAGTPITNTGNIFFDYNPAVITAPSVLVAAMSTGSAEVSLGPMYIFPNPGQAEVRIRSNDPTHKLFRLDVISVDGRTVLRENAFMEGAPLDVRTLPSGTYLLRLTDTDGAVRQASFVRH